MPYAMGLRLVQAGAGTLRSEKPFARVLHPYPVLLPVTTTREGVLRSLGGLRFWVPGGGHPLIVATDAVAK